jgi:hypothetical protein
MRAVTCTPCLIQRDKTWDFGPQEILRHKLSKRQHNVPKKTFCEATYMGQN